MASARSSRTDAHLHLGRHPELHLGGGQPQPGLRGAERPTDVGQGHVRHGKVDVAHERTQDQCHQHEARVGGHAGGMRGRAAAHARQATKATPVRDNARMPPRESTLELLARIISGIVAA